MSPDTQMVLTFILANPGVKNRTIANTLKLPLGTVNSAVTRLRKDGLVNPAVTDLESTFYGQCWPVESECPAQTAVETTGSAHLTSGSVAGSMAETLVDLGNTTPVAHVAAASQSESGGDVPPATIASATPAFPSDPFVPPLYAAEPYPEQPAAPGHFPFLPNLSERIYVPTHPGMDENHLAALGAAQELAGEVAALKAQIATIRILLCCDGRPEDALCHLSDVLVDAGVFVPVCDRAPNCKSLHLPTRIHLLSDDRDHWKREAEKNEARAKMAEDACERWIQQANKMEGKYDEAYRELQSTKRFLAAETARANRAEDELAEIDWACDAVGFPGTGDTVDRFEWLLEHIGADWIAAAMRQRRKIADQIRDLDAALQNLVKRVRVGLPAETPDRCPCGGEATKVEGEEGFTRCDDCYGREGAE